MHRVQRLGLPWFDRLITLQRFCSGSALQPLYERVASVVEQQLSERCGGNMSQAFLPLREVRLPDELGDELDKGVKESLMQVNQQRLAEFVATPQRPLPSLFFITETAVRVATKVETRQMVMNKLGLTTPAGFAEALSQRDKLHSSIVSSPQASLSVAPNVRAFLATLPPFCVPLSVAAARYATVTAAGAHNPCSGDDSLSIVDVTVLRRFRELCVSGYAEYLDHVGPWKTPPDLSRVDDNAFVAAASDEFIGVLPPFAELADPSASANYDRWKVPEHDVWRLSRYLHTKFYITVASLVKGPVAELLTRPVMHVVCANPTIFEYLPAGQAPMPGFPVVNLSAMFDQDPVTSGIPSLLPVTPTLTTEALSEMPRGPEVDTSLGVVRFILAASEYAATTGGVPLELQALSEPQLQDLLRMCTLARRDPKGSVRNEAAQRFGLRKPLPRGAGMAGFKHKVIRAMLLKRFPYGTPFMCRHVLAYFIFDALPPNASVDLLKLRQALLPEDGRTVYPISSDFICKFRHLWIPIEQHSMHWLLHRADSTNPPEIKSPSDFTEQELVDIFLTCAPGGDSFDPTRKTSFSSVTSRLPEVVRERVRSEGGLPRIMQRHPERFTVLDNEFFLWRAVAATQQEKSHTSTA